MAGLLYFLLLQISQCFRSSSITHYHPPPPKLEPQYWMSEDTLQVLQDSGFGNTLFLKLCVRLSQALLSLWVQ